MAAPLSAGCATLVRQSLVDNGVTTPSAELVKGILINSADPHQGSRPNFRSGWGLINLRHAIEDNFQFDDSRSISMGETNNYTIPVAANSDELRVTLLWSDPPAASLQNDLDLTITSPSGVVHSSRDANNITPDRFNNVEGIDRPDPESGNWTISVTPHQFSVGSSQQYTVIVSTR